MRGPAYHYSTFLRDPDHPINVADRAKKSIIHVVRSPVKRGQSKTVKKYVVGQDVAGRFLTRLNKFQFPSKGYQIDNPKVIEKRAKREKIEVYKRHAPRKGYG